jgi:translation elongation factor P/translation initiation factor 5A
MITKKGYLKAKETVAKYDKQLELQVVMWRCNQSIKEIDDETIVFTNQSTYKQVGVNGNDVIILIDNKGNRKAVHRYWFTSI